VTALNVKFLGARGEEVAAGPEEEIIEEEEIPF